MRSEDLPAVSSLESSAYAHPWPEATFRDELANPWSTCVVLRDGDRIVAHLVTWSVADELTIMNVAVDPTRRRQGLAERLLLDALATARSAGLRVALLEVRASNTAARALYEKLGFRVSGVRRRYYESNGEDAVLMELVLAL